MFEKKWDSQRKNLLGHEYTQCICTNFFDKNIYNFTQLIKIKLNFKLKQNVINEKKLKMFCLKINYGKRTSLFSIILFQVL